MSETTQKKRDERLKTLEALLAESRRYVDSPLLMATERSTREKCVQWIDDTLWQPGRGK